MITDRRDRATQDQPELSQAEMQRYGRHLVLPEVGLSGQLKLKQARVLLIGAGGLGSPLGLYLAAAGIGTLGLVDDDRVDASNLQRQVLYDEADLGRLKVEAAAERLRRLNPHIQVEAHALRLDADNALDLVSAYDVVVDGSDNFPTRYLVNDACVLAGKPLVWGAVSRFEGQAALFWAQRGACYRCLFPEPPPPGLVPNCAEGGVLGVLPGIIGTIQANEAIKWVLQEYDEVAAADSVRDGNEPRATQAQTLAGRLLVFDALRLRFRELSLRKDPACPVCGERPTITELRAESAVCAPGQREDGFMEIDVQRLHAWIEEGRELVLLDVREPHEHQLCRLEGAQLLPLGELPQRNGELNREATMVVYCHHGGRSANAVAFLQQQGFANAINLAGGIDAWSRHIDSQVPRY